jgi:response regulator RpfG family c-di-GMP phosphodiesterase
MKDESTMHGSSPVDEAVSRTDADFLKSSGFGFSTRRKARITDTKDPGRASDDVNGLKNKAKKAKVCIIDSHDEEIERLNGLLTAMDCETLCLDRVIGASNVIRGFEPDLMVVDVKMPSLSGEGLIKVLRRNLIDLPVLIIFSDMDERELARLAKAARADDFVIKDGNFLSIVNRIKFHLKRISGT